MPAALVELGFITEKGDAAILESETAQERIATAILDALADFVGE
jgi:N-acetylmuramoyl-L-alanine amidase